MSLPFTLRRSLVDARYLVGLIGFLRQPVTRDEGKAEIRRRLANREAAFLDILERAVYARPQSPYNKLLRHAGIQLEDIKRDVRELGLEATLHKLYDAGIRVNTEEVRGRVPIERAGGLSFRATPADFDNPLLGGIHMLATTSGSTGQPLEVRTSLRTTAAECIDSMVSTTTGIGGPRAIWGPGSSLGLVQILKSGNDMTRFFTTRRQPGLRLQLLFAYTKTLARLYGFRVAKHELVLRNQPDKIVGWLAEMTAAGTPATILCHANPAVRICLAARQAGLDISGTLFYVFGEPFTPGKAAVLRSVGARAHAAYAMTEVGGVISMSCPHSTELDEGHFFADKLALIQRDHQVAPGSSVGSLVFTTLMPQAPKILLNFECGDYANVTERRCSCIMGEVGLSTHLSGIRSYEKLTSDGITFIGSRLYELVEDLLPGRFGGSVNDYQLVEEEQEDGLSRISLIVSPRVGPLDEREVVAALLQAFEETHAGPGGAEMVDQVMQAGNISVVRRDPYETATMKILPLHILHTKRD